MSAVSKSVSGQHLAARKVELNRMAHRAILENNHNFSLSMGQISQRSDLQELQLLQSQEIRIAAKLVQVRHGRADEEVEQVQCRMVSQRMPFNKQIRDKDMKHFSISQGDSFS